MIRRPCIVDTWKHAGTTAVERQGGGCGVEVRCYRPGDAPAIVDLWNDRVAGCFATGALTDESFLADVVGKYHFDPEGLKLVFSGGRLVALAHAGFRSSDQRSPDTRMGTLSLLAVREGAEAAGRNAVHAAVRYLVGKGARAVGAFTIDFPNTPFYNGLYGGEKAGMDESHPLGRETLGACGFMPTSGAVVMTLEMDDRPESADLPTGARLNVAPWLSAFTDADGERRYGIPESIRQAELLDASGRLLARMIFWHLERYNRSSGAPMAVVSHVWSPPEARGTGAMACLQRRVQRLLHDEGARCMALGTGGANAVAVRFYRKLGYRAVCNALQFYLDWSVYEEIAS